VKTVQHPLWGLVLHKFLSKRRMVFDLGDEHSGAIPAVTGGLGGMRFVDLPILGLS